MAARLENSLMLWPNRPGGPSRHGLAVGHQLDQLPVPVQAIAHPEVGLKPDAPLRGDHLVGHEGGELLLPTAHTMAAQAEVPILDMS